MKFKKVLHWLDLNFETLLMAPLLMAVTFFMVYDITAREVFSNGAAWPQELARYTMLYITFIGISYGVRYNGHIRVDIIPQLFPKTARVLDIVSDVLMMVFAVFILYGGYQKLGMLAKGNQVSTALEIPIIIVYAGLEVGWVMAFLRLLQKTINRIFFHKPNGFDEHRETIMDD